MNRVEKRIGNLLEVGFWFRNPRLARTAEICTLLVCFSGISLQAQVQSDNAKGGAATRGAFAPVLDSEKRPITKGGFVKTGPVVFRDIAAKAGLTGWTHTMGSPRKDYLIETTGSGVGLFDFDQDGWLDIYIVNGSTMEALKGQAAAPQAALFHNNHDGTFTNVAVKAGVTNERWGLRGSHWRL